MFLFSTNLANLSSTRIQISTFINSLIQHSVPVVDIPPLNLHLPLPLVLTLPHHVNHPSSSLPPAAVRSHRRVIVQVVLLVVVGVLLVGGGGCGPPSHSTSQIRLQRQEENHVDYEDAHHPQNDDHHHFDDRQRTLFVFARTPRTKLFNLILCHVSENLKNDVFAVAVRGVDTGADVDLPAGKVCDNVRIHSASLWTSAAASRVHMVGHLRVLAMCCGGVQADQKDTKNHRFVE